MLATQVQIHIEAEKAFEAADWALLIGAQPRGPGMERRDLLDLNGQIFEKQVRPADQGMAASACGGLVAWLYVSLHALASTL